MTGPGRGWPATLVPSLLAALTAWVALWAWAGFVQHPSGYLVPTLWAGALVATIGMLLRAARVPSLLVVVAQVLLVGTWLVHRWAAEAAWGGWVPTPAALDEAGEVLRASALAAQSYAAPVADTPSIFPLLVLSGAAVMVAVDFLACGLRRVPVAGLPLLAVYTAAASILDDGLAWWVFAAGAASFLTLLVADEGRRLAQWGRHVTRSGRTYEDPGLGLGAGSVRSAARRIGAAATGLAVVAPWLLPTWGGGLLDGPGGGDGPGDGVSISNPLVSLRRDLVRGADVDLVRVRTDGNPSYLRISVLDEFTGDAWRPSRREIPAEQRAAGALPPPPGLSDTVERRAHTFAIEVEGAFDSTWLPTPYPVTHIEVDGDWRYDTDTGDFLSADEGVKAAGLRYLLRALEISPTAEQLRGAGLSPDAVETPNTELPDDLPDLVEDLARELTAGLPTDFDKAVRLQRWFREDGGFTYSLNRDAGSGADDLTAFLSAGPGGRIGYCEQFAASMALMGRTLDIPSRVAVGFLHPERVAESTYVFSAHDLHAWPEMYFDGVGWVRFEPTPGDRAASVPRYTTGDLAGPLPTTGPSAPTPSAGPLPADRPGRELDPGSGAVGGAGPGRSPVLVALLTMLLVVVLLSVPRLARTVVRRRRWAAAATTGDVAETAWSELRDEAVDLRLPWDDAMTLRTRAADLAASFGAPGAAEARHQGARMPEARGRAANPRAAAALDRLVARLEEDRFARAASPDSVATLGQAQADVEACLEALREGASPRARRLARWLPASLLDHAPWRSPQRGVPMITETVGTDRAV